MIEYLIVVCHEHEVDPNIFERAAKYVKQFTGLFVPERNNID